MVFWIHCENVQDVSWYLQGTLLCVPCDVGIVKFILIVCCTAALHGYFLKTPLVSCWHFKQSLLYLIPSGADTAFHDADNFWVGALTFPEFLQHLGRNSLDLLIGLSVSQGVNRYSSFTSLISDTKGLMRW